MTRFIIKLSNGLAILAWAYTWKQIGQHGRNLAKYHSCKLVSIEEI